MAHRRNYSRADVQRRQDLPGQLFAAYHLLANACSWRRLSGALGESAFGVLWDIAWGRIRDDYLPRLTSDGGWEFLHIFCDSPITNYKMMWHIVAQSMQFPRSVVSFAPFFAHIISLVVKWGIGMNFDYGCMLRTRLGFGDGIH